MSLRCACCSEVAAKVAAVALYVPPDRSRVIGYVLCVGCAALPRQAVIEIVELQIDEVNGRA